VDTVEVSDDFLERKMKELNRFHNGMGNNIHYKQQCEHPGCDEMVLVLDKSKGIRSGGKITRRVWCDDHKFERRCGGE